MSTRFSCVLYSENGTQRTWDTCFSYRVVRDRYVPYSTLNISLSYLGDELSMPNRVKLSIGGQLIHEGPVDSIHMRKEKHRRVLDLTSRGYTALLLQNQLEQGMRTDVTIQSLLEIYQLPSQITWSRGVTGRDYLYLDKTTTLWDALSAFSYRTLGVYPFIKNGNEIQFTEENPAQRILSADHILEWGRIFRTDRLISVYHMEDSSGSADAYEYTPSGIPSSIVRNQKLKLDYRFLSNPQNALTYRDLLAKRRSAVFCVKHHGWHWIQLGDLLSVESFFQEKKVLRIVNTGRDGTHITEVEVQP